MIVLLGFVLALVLFESHLYILPKSRLTWIYFRCCFRYFVPVFFVEG